MSSGQFPFSIPERSRPMKPRRISNLRVKKASSKAAKDVWSSHAYSIPRRKGGYTDLDDPHGASSSSPSRPQPLFKQSRQANRRHTATRAARVILRSPSKQKSDKKSQDSLSSTGSKESIFGAKIIEKRLKASSRGTIHSGVDNKFSSIVRKTDIPWPWEDENVLKTDRHIETAKVESVAEKIILPRGVVARQLKRLVGRICESDIDKYQLLDERDKLMCRGRSKAADVENASVVQGTCPDMCPEKERYMRVVQKRLSNYECYDDGRMAPELTVKEYSRSAADQEEPLPHELRPADVLRRTMNYLIRKIANNVPETDEVLAQWYDFLWNRTRAIRKDITQQMMVNDTAVSLIEQCVRMHIFASHRLCELNFNEFDQKMNTENLSKSLQSLRYLYDDLAKKGIYYSTEAEFRAYEIMLNLSDSNVFRQALTYRREILEASSVRLAIHLFTCLQNHNYVRFFRLLRKDATYLQCCLCHRYFSRIRHQAICAISQSVHVTGKFPVNKLIQLLGFDDRQDAIQFLDCYNMRRINDLDTEEELMLMSKTRLIEAIEEPASRMHTWIEEKRGSQSITEVLSGGLNFDVEISVPLNSFDKHGAYLFDVVLNDYISETGTEQASTVEDETVNFTFAFPGSQKEDDVLDTFAEKLMNDIMNEEITRMCRLTYGKSLAHSLTSEFYKAVLDECIKPCCQEAFMAAKLLHRRQLVADAVNKRRHEIQSLNISLNDSVLCEVIDRLIWEICDECVKKYQREHDEKHLEDVIRSFLNGLLMEVVTETVKRIGKNKIEEGVSLVRQRLREINERLDKLWLKQFVDRWRNQIAIRKEEERRKIELLSTFPVLLPAKCGLVYRRSDGNPLKRGFIDCSSLLFEQKIRSFVEQRHKKIAQRVFAKWKQWTEKQIKKREFFTSTKSNSLLKQRKQKIPNENEAEMRLAVAFAEVECEQLKPFWANWEVKKILQMNQRQSSWHKSLAERSSALLDYVDEETLERGVETARRNMCYIGVVQRQKNLNCSDYNESFDSSMYYGELTTNSSMNISKNRTECEGNYPPVKRKRKTLMQIAERLQNFTKELDDACEGIEERNRRYDKILSSLRVSD